MAEKKPATTTRLKPERIQSQLKSERVQDQLRPERIREGFLDLEKFGQLIVAVRRDMGHMKTDISHDEVLRPFIRDYDDREMYETL